MYYGRWFEMELTLQEQLTALMPEMVINNRGSKDNIKAEANKFNNVYKLSGLHSSPNKNVTMNKINNNNKEIRKPQRKEIWNINLGNPIGSLQKGIRPCLVNSNDLNNKYSNVINVYPLTSSMTKARIPVHIEIEGYGLTEKSIILVEQGIPIDIRYQLLDYVGTVDDLVMKKVAMDRNIQYGDLKPKNTLERLPENMYKKIVNNFRMIETYDTTIKIMKINNVDNNSICLIDNEKFREVNALKCYCDDNNLNYDEIYNNYKSIKMEGEDDDLIAL
jgi:mRNA-degrading endonuclease toxin of MazEF toxin-antitoxin module